MLAGIEIALELFVELVDQVVDSRNRLELYAPQNGSFKGLGERLLDFLCASELVEMGSARRNSGEGPEDHTSDSRASKKLRPEWPVIWHMKRFW